MVYPPGLKNSVFLIINSVLTRKMQAVCALALRVTAMCALRASASPRSAWIHPALSVRGAFSQKFELAHACPRAHQPHAKGLEAPRKGFSSWRACSSPSFRTEVNVCARDYVCVGVHVDVYL